MRRIALMFAAAALTAALAPAYALAAQDSQLQAAPSGGLGGRAAAAEAVSTQASANANTSYKSSAVGNDYTVKAGGAIVRAVHDGPNYSDPYTLVMTKGGKTRTLARNADCRFTTNGRYVYYSKRGRAVSYPYGKNPTRYYNTHIYAVYRLDTVTGKRIKLGSGADWVVYSANSSYAYCGRHYTPPLGSSAYAVNVKTKKRREITPSGGTIRQCAGNRVLVSSVNMNFGSVKVYSYKLDGTGKRKVAEDVCRYKVNGNKVTFLQYGNIDRYRVCQCTVADTSRKALTGWKSGQKSADALTAKYKLETP